MRPEVNFLELETVISTNSYLLEKPDLLVPGRVVYSMNQTGGRGRLGRVWESPQGKSLAVSVVVESPKQGIPSTWIPLLAGACATKMVTDLGVSGATIKWPNDVLVGSDKLAGILTEVSENGSIVVGMGINLRATPEGIEGATSLESLGIPSKLFVEKIIQPWVDDLLALLDTSLDQQPDETMTRWRSAVEISMSTIGKQVQISRGPGDTVLGTAIGLDASGGLVVSLEDERDVVIHAGDVFHIERS